jgi:hypothetical protein
MALEKVAIKNERPGVMVTPGLRPPDDPDRPPSTDKRASKRKSKPDR